MSRLWRVYHPELPGVRGASFDLAAEESHHVRKVLRLRPGEPLAVFDGRGQEWRAVLVRHEGPRVTLRLEERIDRAPEPPLDIRLYPGLCKPDRMEWVVQKATELGVAALHPFASRRAERRGPGGPRLERWRRIAIEACKQCGRNTAPAIEPLPELPAVPGKGTVAWVLDPAGAPLGEQLGEIHGRPCVWIAVGPQAGLEPDEVLAWRALGWRPAGLGPRVLRAETAAIVAAAIVLHRLGDLGRGQP